jgi:hypothetical protein
MLNLMLVTKRINSAIIIASNDVLETRISYNGTVASYEVEDETNRTYIISR